MYLKWGSGAESNTKRRLTQKIINSTIDTELATNSSKNAFEKWTVFEFSQTAWNEVRCLEWLGVEADPATEEADVNTACTKIFSSSLVSTVVRGGGKIRIIGYSLASWCAHSVKIERKVRECYN